MSGMTPLIHTGLLSYPCRYMQPGCLLRTTSEWCRFVTYMYKGTTSLSNIHCPLGPYIPAAMMCLSAVQAPCPTKPQHTTPSAPQQAARHSNNTSCNVTPCFVPPRRHANVTRMLHHGLREPSLRVMRVPNRPCHVPGAWLG